MTSTSVSLKKSKRIVTGLADDTTGDMPPPDKIICACADLNFARFEQAVAKLQNQSFETLLKQTDSGNTCTACLLDLEYYFVALRTQPRKQAATKVGESTVSAPSLPLKQHIYKWLDAITPPVAWAPPNRVPLLMGRGIETWLTVTNHDLLFQDRKSAPLMTSVHVRRSDGKRLWRGKFEIAQGKELKIRLDQHLQPGSNDLTVGSACVSSKAMHPAMRGTMRPQLEILAPAGTCALHAQGDAGPGDTWFTIQNRPDDQRVFLILMNNTSSAQTATISYPHEIPTNNVEPGDKGQVALPPRGTGLYEINLPEALSERIMSRPFAVRTRTQGACRVFLVCATPTLDRFSIDHR